MQLCCRSLIIRIATKAPAIYQRSKKGVPALDISMARWSKTFPGILDYAIYVSRTLAFFGIFVEQKKNNKFIRSCSYPDLLKPMICVVNSPTNALAKALQAGAA